MEKRRTVSLSWLVLAFFLIVAKTHSSQFSQSSSSMSSSSVTPRTLSSSSSSSAMSLSSVTPRTLASSSSSLAMSSSRLTPSTLASFSSPMPSLPVTPSTLASFSSPMSSSRVTPSTFASLSSLSAMSSSPVTPSTLASLSSLLSMPSSPVSPSILAFFFSLSAISSSPVTPTTLASFSSPSAMSSSRVTPSTLASFSSLPSPSTPPVTAATNSPVSSPSTLPVTPATKPPECSNYKFLNDSSIAATYRRDDLYYSCKDNVKPGWHRFGGEAGNQMADTCVKMCHCGVVYPGWLSGGHPSVEDGAVVRRVCFGRGCTCDTFVYISVRNCSGFYVYNLTSIPSSNCHYGYCASTGFEGPTTSTTEFSKQRLLNGTNGSISFQFQSHNNKCLYPHYSWQIAAKKGEKVMLVIQSMDISWWDGSCTLVYMEIQNGTYADGKPMSKRMCSSLLSGIVTFYSQEGQSLGVVLNIKLAKRPWSWVYFTATYTVISYNDTVSNECSNYGFLNESNRAMTYVNRSIGNLCDSTLSGWYRFSGEAGTQMADSCRKMYHCNTDSPGWLDGSHPTVAEGIVQRKVCFVQHSNGTDCCYFSKNISVRNCGAFYVYRLDPPRCNSRYCGNGLPQAPECSNYKFLNDSRIAATYTLWEQPHYSCYVKFKPGWHRFVGEAGNQMADTCVKMCHCASWHPGWLTGGHPSVEDGTVVRKVCFVGSLGCCKASVYISVRNCSGFYVYNLTSMPSRYYCDYGYCASSGFEEATTSEFSNQHLLYRENGFVSFYSYFQYRDECLHQDNSWQIAAKKGEKVKLEIQYMDVYWWDARSGPIDYLEIRNATYADGKPISARMGGTLLSGIVTFYSHVGQSLEVVVANRDISWGYVYFDATYTVISYNNTVSNECSNYRILNESNRAMTHVNSSIGNLCDSTLSGWYRFSGEAGTQMADSCRNMYHCNTFSPGFLDGTHPTVAEGIVERKVCFLQHLNGTDCCYFSKNISVRNCGAFYVYRLDPLRCYSRYCGNGLPQAPECSNYKSLTEANRAATHGHNRFQSLLGCVNESTLSGWYRFDREAGNQMADTCVERYHCGAKNPGWLDGGHPSVRDGAVVRRVCFTGDHDCCEYFVYISVRNCGGFYVYKLSPLHTSSYCYYRYCASNGTALVLTTTLTTDFVSELLTSSAAQTTGTPTTFLAEITSTTAQTTTRTPPRLSTSSTAQTTTEPPTTKGEKIPIDVNVNVTEEQDVTLNCTTSKEAPSPKWSRKDGEAVETQSRVLKDDETKLRITSASVRDAGIFYCESDHDNIKYIFNVSVKVLVKVEMVIKVLNYQYTPQLQNKSSKIFIETAENFTAEMDIVYKNTPGYVRTEVLNFTKGSVKVDFRVIIIIVATDPKNESTITDKKAETGQRIIRKAKTGSVERLKVSPDVEVKAPPPDPRDVEIFDLKSDELSVRWIPPEDLKAFNVYEYKVQHRRFQMKDVSTNDIPASEGRDKYSYRIQNLEPETTYMISVAAVNKYGSNFNEESGHQTLEPPLAIWIILLIVLGVIFLIAIIIGGIVCFRRRAAERRKRQAEKRALEGFGNPKELDSVLRYEEKNVKGLKFSFVNDSYKPSDVNWTEIPYENINLMDELGSGAFGVVYRGEIIQEKDDVTPCAVKTVKASASHEEIRDLYNELEIMTNVGYHPNLVNLLGACTKDGNLLVVLEIAENGSLLDFLKKSRNGNENYEGDGIKSGGLAEDMKLRIATDVAKGMAYLASHRCIHRDLAARNVLLGENYVAKVADYGMARDVYESLMYKKETQGKLPVKWMAIESLETYVFTVESDIWSYGVLLWEIESGGLKPYAGMTTQEIMTELKKGYRLEKPSGCSDAMYQVMRDCWNPNPKLRPSFEKLVERLEAMV